MPLKLMYITNNAKVARIAEKSGVDRIFIDLEINGKDKRQGHLDTIISRHSIEDVHTIKKALSKANLLVRVNPIFNASQEEIDRIIHNGADIVMLPFFKTANEVELFVNYVGNRTKTCLLVETPEAVDNIDSILDVGGIDMIHIGLNDLHLGYGMKFMFELLANGVIERLCGKFKKKGIPYGFGGIAQLGKGELPAEYVIGEHYRLGSSMTILSRSFCNSCNAVDICEIEETFRSGIEKIREFENQIKAKDEGFFERNRKTVTEKVAQIKRKLESKNEE